MNVNYRPKSLLVDNNPRVRSFVKPALKAEGYLVFEAGDGPTGVYIAEEKEPELIILDAMLDDSDFDGLDVCLLLREMSNRTPVIFLTVQDWADYPGTFQRAYALGEEDYIAKRQELRRVEDGMQVYLFHRRMETRSHSPPIGMATWIST